jgi:hypothetical protein
MVDCRHYWLVVVPSMLVWMGVVSANGLVVASTYLVLSLVISDANEDWFPFACYEDVFFLEYVDALIYEDQNRAII